MHLSLPYPVPPPPPYLSQLLLARAPALPFSGGRQEWKRPPHQRLLTLSVCRASQAQAALREASLLSRLHHPNIIHYYDSFLEADHLHLVMTYCPGGDLFSKVRRARERGRPFPEARVVTWLMQLVSALAYIHSKKIMHRDLKTQNIFIGRDGALRLGDFGLAKVLERTGDFATTFTGTPFYLAPEICMSQNYGFQSDVWSLGCVLYELCTLEHAFAADSLLSLVYKIVRGSFEPLPPGRYDPRVSELVERLLSREPGARPTARALWRDPWLAAKKADIEEWVEAKQRSRAARAEEEASSASSSAASSLRSADSSSGADLAAAAPASLSEQALTPRERMLARKAEAARLRQMELQVAAREQARPASRLSAASGPGAVRRGGEAAGSSCDGIIETQSDFVRVEQAVPSPKETAKSDPSPDKLRPSPNGEGGGRAGAALNRTFRGGRGGGAAKSETTEPSPVWSPKSPAGPSPILAGAAVEAAEASPTEQAGEDYESDFEDYDEGEAEDAEEVPEELDFSQQSQGVGGDSFALVSESGSLDTSQQRVERLCSLRGRCETALGPRFQAVYDYLKGVRQADDGVGLKAEEDEDIKQALQLLAGPGGLNACFQVDLLVFQELVASG